jgi:hypothetical protein
MQYNNIIRVTISMFALYFFNILSCSDSKTIVEGT